MWIGDIQPKRQFRKLSHLLPLGVSSLAIGMFGGTYSASAQSAPVIHSFVADEEDVFFGGRGTFRFDVT